jgi:hypothetical protein
LIDNDKNGTKLDPDPLNGRQGPRFAAPGLMVFETVRRARSRILVNEVARQGAFAFSAALGSLILLLLFGTQILTWVWLVVLPVITLGVGAYVTWRHMPSLYTIAQCVDHRLGLPDTISTALFFSTAEHRVSPGACQVQRSHAERAAAKADLRRAIPIRVPRAIYGTALLGLIASSLFALRYGLNHRLDLQPPLARIIQEKLGFGEQPQLARARKPASVRPPDRREDLALPPDQADQKGPSELDAARDSALDTVEVPDVDNSKKGSGQSHGSKQAESRQAGGEQNEDEDSEGVSANAGNQQSPEGRQGPGAGKQGQGGEKQGVGSSGENASLLGKFRDAMSSLLSRMRQQPGAGGAQQEAPGQNGRQAENQSGNGRQGGQQSRQNGNGQQADGQDGQSGEESQNAQSAQAKSSGENGQEPSTKQPGSGIGRQDGSKDVKLAEQLAAMGKISEIIGKRSANVSGEVTVEVQNSNPQLRTPYAQRDAHHTEAGGEISRDEVPVALQAYVQQYFEQVRKLAPESHSHRKQEAPKTPSF